MAYGSFNAGPGKAPDEDVVRTNQIGVPAALPRWMLTAI